MDERRRLHDKSALNLPYALVSAAYVDVLIGRHDLAVARLEEDSASPRDSSSLERCFAQIRRGARCEDTPRSSG